MKNKYKLIIIGGGAGGFAAAIKANELKIETLIVNSGLPLGGTCVNVGCVPSKYMIENGEYIYSAKYPRSNSIKVSGVDFDFKKIIEEELNIVKQMRNDKYEKVLSNLEYVKYLQGQATFVSPNEIEILGKILKGDKFIIATGSKANIPDIEGIDNIEYMTHIEALKTKIIPERLIVVGSGPVGIEFAQMYSHFGSKVTMVLKGDRLFKETEPEISSYIEEYFRKEGIEIIKNTNIVKFEKKNNGEQVAYTEDRKDIIFNKVLFAIGKTPNISSLNLKKANVDVSINNAIKVSKHLQTSNSNIYAVGDVVDLPKRLETTAGREGTLAVQNIIKADKLFINYFEVPYAIFATPSIAGVGLRDEDIPLSNFNCSCLTLTLDKVPKAILIGDTRGFIKMIINNETKQILGIHLISKDAVEIIHEAVIIVKNKMTVSEVADTIHVFPTLSEVIKLVAQSALSDLATLSCCI